MNKTIRLYIVFLIMLLIGIIILDINKPKPINWIPTYSIKDKIPFGLYVFDQELPFILKPFQVQKIVETPYEYLEKQFDYDTLVQNYKTTSTLLSINEYSTLDPESIKELCYYANHGNTVFLSAKSFPQILLDSLKLKISSDYQYSDSIYCWMANKHFVKKKYNIVQGVGNEYFSKIDTTTTTVLGYQTGDSTRVNFIKVPYKSGNFILHTQPAVFTNYHLLKENHSEYTADVLRYLPKKNVVWFIKDQDGNQISDSQFRYILAQPALTWAWYIFLLGMIFFMIFNAKRRQRIVPIIKPLQNTTVDFAKTIGNLYFQESDHRNMIDKKIVYFLERIRQDFLIDTTKLDDIFIKRLQLKTGKEITIITELVGKINQHRQNINQPIESDLIAIDRTMETIFEKNKS